VTRTVGVSHLLPLDAERSQSTDLGSLSPLANCHPIGDH
jgi:hypothetical protein